MSLLRSKPSLSHPRPKRFKRGFTLIEVMVAAIILGLTSFALLSMIRAGDQLAVRARTNGALSAQIKARGGLLTALTYDDSSSIIGTWYRGGLGGTAATPPFPSLLRLPGDGLDSDIPYLIYGKPLPGDTEFRPLGAYLETILVESVSAGVISISYTLQWRDPSGMPGSDDKISDINLQFLKNDPSLY